MTVKDEAHIILQRIALAVAVLCALAAVAALGDLALRAALRLETRWDTFAYHLPFAAKRGGLPIPYTMNEAMELYYQGFPPLPHVVQGLLWRVTGTVNATGVVGWFAFAGFLAWCHVALNARFWLVALIALTAPMVVIHAAASYVDLFSNSLLALGAASCLSLYLHPERRARLVFVGGLAGLAGACWSKFQLVPVAGLLIMLFAIVAWHRSAAIGWRPQRVMAVVGVAALAAALPYLANLVAYGNPFWPVRMPVIGDLLPYKVDPIAQGVASQRPPPLKDYGAMRLFLHSLLEIGHPTHYDHRQRWIIDQGNAWVAFRMGGFWAVGVVFYLASMIALLVRTEGRRGMVASAGALFVLAFVAVLPQSHELRYYLFLPLAWAAAVAMTFQKFQVAMPRWAIVFLLVVLGLFGYMVAENRDHYRIESSDYAAAAKAWGAAPWWGRLERGRTYCAVDMMPVGMMLTGPTMTEFTIVDRSKSALCPEGSIVATADGRLRPLGEIAPSPAPVEDVRAQKSREQVNESLRRYQAGRFDESIAAAEQALAFDPANADAYNNICAAHNAMKRWEAGIAACEKALALRPDYQLAKNNLAWAHSGRGGGAGKAP